MYLSGGSALVSSTDFAVTNADLDVERSAITGAASFTAGGSETYRFEAKDVYGNVAVFQPNTVNTLATFDESEFRTFTITTGGSQALDSIALSSDELALDLTVSTDVAGTYLVRVVYGPTRLSVTPELVFGPIVVEPQAIDAASTQLLVRASRCVSVGDAGGGVWADCRRAAGHRRRLDAAAGARCVSV